MLRHRFLWRGWELEDWEQEERSFLVGERRPLTGWLFSQIHFTLELSSWEIELPSGLAMLKWRFEGFRVKWLHQALHEFWQALGERSMLPWHAPWLCCYPWGSIGMSERSSSHFVGSSQNGLSSILRLVMNASLSIPLAQTTESVMIGQALNKFELWRMKTLN